MLTYSVQYARDSPFTLTNRQILVRQKRLFFQSLAYQTRKRDRHKRKEQAKKIYKIAGGPLFAISNSKKRVKYCYSEHKKHTALSATNKREEIIEKKSSEKQARLQVREIMAMVSTFFSRVCVTITRRCQTLVRVDQCISLRALYLSKSVKYVESLTVTK